MSPARVPRPRTAQGPEYVLRCVTSPPRWTGKSLAGFFYSGLSDEGSHPLWATLQQHASRMRGAGLASAERALERRGYTVERVPA